MWVFVFVWHLVICILRWSGRSYETYHKSTFFRLLIRLNHDTNQSPIIVIYYGFVDQHHAYAGKFFTTHGLVLLNNLNFVQYLSRGLLSSWIENDTFTASFDLNYPLAANLCWHCKNAFGNFLFYSLLAPIPRIFIIFLAIIWRWNKFKGLSTNNFLIYI